MRGRGGRALFTISKINSGGSQAELHLQLKLPPTNRNLPSITQMMLILEGLTTVAVGEEGGWQSESG